MNHRKALWQVCAASLVLAALLLWLLSLGPRSAQIVPTTYPVNSVNVADIAAVAVKNGSDAYGLMVGPDGAVTLVASGDAAGADYSADEMQGLIVLLARLTANQALQPQQNLADFGLSEPSATLAMILKDGRTERLRLGKPSAMGDGYYLQKEGDERVFVIGKLTGDLLLRARVDFWNKQLLPQLTADMVERLTSVQLASRLRPQANWRVEHRGGARFLLAQPVNGMVHAEDMFNRLLLPLSELQADGLVSATGPLAAFGLDQPTQELTLQWDGQTIRLLIAPDLQGGFFVHRQGHRAVFSLSDEKAPFLRLAYRDLLGDRAYNGSLAAVASITLTGPAEQAVYTMSIQGEGVGLSGAMQGRTVPYADLGRVLAPLFDIGIVAEVERDAQSRAVLDRALAQGPHTSVTVTNRDGSIDRIEFFTKEASMSYLRLNGRVDFLVYTRAADALAETLARVRQNVPTADPPVRPAS